MSAQILTPNDVVILSDECVQGSDRDVVDFNVVVVNSMLREMLRFSEISREAVQSYYVDYYLTQVENGGFAQFVFNTNWGDQVVSLVKTGLEAIGAARHVKLFEKGEWLVSREPSKLRKFLTGEFFGLNKDRDRFNSVTAQFYELNEVEDITALNATWLKTRPGALVLPRGEIRRELERRFNAVPDRDARKADVLAKAPRYMKIIYALCAEAGQTVETVTAGDPTYEYSGVRTLAWHFITDKGHHFMVEASGKLLMFNGTSKELMLELPAERVDAI